MVAQPWDYPWSSCRAYALGQADPLVTLDPMYLEMSLSPERRQMLWREFLLADDPREGKIRQGDWVLGDDDFRTQMARVLGRPMPGPRGRPRGRRKGAPLIT
jgi:putative transposase